MVLVRCAADSFQEVYYGLCAVATKNEALRNEASDEALRPIYTEELPGVAAHDSLFVLLRPGVAEPCTSAELPGAKKTKDYAWQLLASPQCRLAFNLVLCETQNAIAEDKETGICGFKLQSTPSLYMAITHHKNRLESCSNPLKIRED